MSLYGLNPKYRIGDIVTVRIGEWHRLGVISAVTFASDEQEERITVYYEVELGGVFSEIYEVTEDEISPLQTPNHEKSIYYEEYDIDSLLDAYNVFKTASGFEDILEKIENELKRRIGTERKGKLK